MADFEEQFTPHYIDQQLDQPPFGAERGQLLNELHRFHNTAASAEKQSLATAWARIEARSEAQQAGRSEKSLLPFPLPESRRAPSPQFRPREPKKHRLATLAAVLAALMLIGGAALALLGQRSAFVAGPTLHQATSTPTRGQQLQQAGKVVYTNNNPDNGMVLAWSPDGKRLLSAGNDVHIWDATTGQNPVTYHPLTTSIPIQNAAWAPDHSQRVAITDGTSVRIIDANTGKVLLTGPKGASTALTAWHPSDPMSQGIASIRALAWSPDGNEIASSLSLFNPATTSRPIVIWNSHTGTVIKTLLGHTDDIYDLAWSPDGKYLASLAQGQDNTVRLWDPATGQQLYGVHPPTGYGAMERLAWSPNSQYLAVQMQVQVGNNTLGVIVTRDEIQVWKASTHAVLMHYPDSVAGSDFTGFSWGPDSTRIVATTGDNVFIWNALTGLNLYTYHSTHREIARLVAWSPNGVYIVQTATQIISQKQSLNITEVWTAPAGV